MGESCCGGGVPSFVGEGEQSCDCVRDIYFGDDDHRGLAGLHPRGEDTVWVFEPGDDVSVSTESSGDLLSVDCPGWDGFRAAATDRCIHVYEPRSVVCLLCGGMGYYDHFHSQFHDNFVAAGDFDYDKFHHHHGPGDNDVLIHQHDHAGDHFHVIVYDYHLDGIHYHYGLADHTHNDTTDGAAHDGDESVAVRPCWSGTGYARCACVDCREA